MGCKGKEKKSSEVAKKRSGHSKVRSAKEPNGCQCAQRFDNSFPYKDLPPPAPPDGRADLWDLQFCRWWGWNWVRKPDSVLVESTSKGNLDSKKPRLTSKRDAWIEAEEEIPTKDTNPEPSPGSSKTKRASFSAKEPEIRQTQQSPMTAKEQFKAMCKCLLGKKNMPPGMAKLYNTPSSSMVAFTQHEKESYGVGETSAEKPSKHGKHKKHEGKCKKEGCNCKDCRRHRSKGKSPKRLFGRESPVSGQSSDVPYESLYTHGRQSSSDGSIEYLTFRLQHINKNDTGISGCCPCQNYEATTNPKKIQQKQPIAVSTDPLVKSTSSIGVNPKGTKETQMGRRTPEKVGDKYKDTQTARRTPERVEDKYSGPSEENSPSNSPFSEKRVMVKGKKQKTICITVCCCGSCQKDNGKCAQPTCSGKCPNSTCPKNEGSKSTDKLKKGEKDASKLLSKDDTFATFALTSVPQLSTKTLSKFGTPSKNYPWMNNDISVSAETINNIDNWTSPLINDFYDWLKPESDLVGLNQLPDLLDDITENLSYLKKLDTSNKTTDEDRILLDAVCDAILKEHDDDNKNYYNQILEEFELRTKDDDKLLNNKDLGVLCNLTNVGSGSKTDVYTELSRALVNTEEIGVQLTKPITDLNSILERSDASRLDTMMGNIMDNIFSKSKVSIDKNNNNDVSQNPSNNNLLTVEHELKKYSTTNNPAKNNNNNEQNAFRFTATDLPGFTRTGLLPQCAATAFRKTVKRGATASGKHENNNWCKKIKQDAEGRGCKNQSEHAKMGNIFCKIEDMVRRSKAKTAELQKALNVIPKKPQVIGSSKNSENVLQIHNLSQNLLTKQNSADNNALGLDGYSIKSTPSKRNYPMSSDTFKGTIYCDALVKRGDFKNNFSINNDNNNNNLSQPFCDGLCNLAPPPILEENSKAFSLKDQDSTNNETIIQSINTDKQKNFELMLNKKLSKLSVHSFVVCNETSKLQSNSSSSGFLIGKKLQRNNTCSKASLIPIRRRSNSNS